jgi:hypothetical protein
MSERKINCMCCHQLIEGLKVFDLGRGIVCLDCYIKHHPLEENKDSKD